MSKRIYEAENGVEAHMVKDLLESEGVESRIDGEYLQGAVGGVPPVGLVGLSVDEQDYAKAKEIIAAWERTQPRDGPESTVARRPRSAANILSLLIGIAIGVGSSVWAYNTPEHIERKDFNNDGNIDERYIYRDDRLVRLEVDGNSDGRVDLVYDYDRYGMVVSSRADSNFDGVFEGSMEYVNNMPLFEKADTNGDGKVDIIWRYINGILFSTQLISPETGLTKKRSYYRLGKLVRSEFDSNNDGTFDVVTNYDFYEETVPAER